MEFSAYPDYDKKHTTAVTCQQRNLTPFSPDRTSNFCRGPYLFCSCFVFFSFGSLIFHAFRHHYMAWIDCLHYLDKLNHTKCQILFKINYMTTKFYNIIFINFYYNILINIIFNFLKWVANYDFKYFLICAIINV